MTAPDQCADSERSCENNENCPNESTMCSQWGQHPNYPIPPSPVPYFYNPYWNYSNPYGPNVGPNSEIKNDDFCQSDCNQVPDQKRNPRATPIPPWACWPYSDSDVTSQRSTPTPVQFWPPYYPPNFYGNASYDGQENCSSGTKCMPYPPPWNPYCFYYGAPPPQPHNMYPPPYSPYPYIPPIQSDNDENSGYSSTDEMAYYGARFQTMPQFTRAPPTKPKAATAPSLQEKMMEEIKETAKKLEESRRKRQELEDANSERVNDVDIQLDVEPVLSETYTNSNDLPTVPLLPTVKVYEDDESSDEVEDSESTTEDIDDSLCSVDEAIPHQLSVIFEESERTESVIRCARENSIESTTTEGTNTLENTDNEDELEEETTVFIKLPLRINYTTANNQKAVITNISPPVVLNVTEESEVSSEDIENNTDQNEDDAESGVDWWAQLSRSQTDKMLNKCKLKAQTIIEDEESNNQDCKNSESEGDVDFWATIRKDESFVNIRQRINERQYRLSEHDVINDECEDKGSSVDASEDSDETTEAVADMLVEHEEDTNSQPKPEEIDFGIARDIANGFEGGEKYTKAYSKEVHVDSGIVGGVENRLVEEEIVADLEPKEEEVDFWTARDVANGIVREEENKNLYSNEVQVAYGVANRLVEEKEDAILEPKEKEVDFWTVRDVANECVEEDINIYLNVDPWMVNGATNRLVEEEEDTNSQPKEEHEGLLSQKDIANRLVEDEDSTKLEPGEEVVDFCAVRDVADRLVDEKDSNSLPKEEHVDFWTVGADENDIVNNTFIGKLSSACYVNGNLSSSYSDLDTINEPSNLQNTEITNGEDHEYSGIPPSSIQERIKALYKSSLYKRDEEVSECDRAPSRLENHNVLLNIENDQLASRKSSLKLGDDGSDDDEEADSGVTSDISRHISEADIELEVVEYKKISKYQRASTHSRLFRLLQDESETDTQEGNVTSENSQSRRDQLNLPLQKNVSNCDSYSSSGFTSPGSPNINEKFVNELIETLLLKKKGRFFKNMTVEKLHSAALRILQEDMDGLETLSSSEDGGSCCFLSPNKTGTGSSTPVRTPQEFSSNTNEYSQYYQTWASAEDRDEFLHEIVPSKAFKLIQEHVAKNRTGAISGLIAQCPRVLSNKNIQKELMRLIELEESSSSPEPSRQTPNVNEATSAS